MDERVPRWLPLSSFLGKGPTYLATYAAWRFRRAFEAKFDNSPAWPATGDLGGFVAKLSRGEAGDIPGRVRCHFLERHTPRSLCSRERSLAAQEAIPESQKVATVKAADGIVERHFCYRGHEKIFGDGPIDWTYRPDGNEDWTLDLNRHHFFVTLGRAYWYTSEPRYATTFQELLLDWMDKNPPGVSEPNWRGVFEVGVRISNWCWAHAHFLDADELDDAAHLEFVRGLLGMGRFLEKHIEVHAWNNHLLLEAKSLAMLGLLYPEFSESRRWRRLGLRLLRTQLSRQVTADGVHSERSSHYHKLVTAEILELLIVMELAGVETDDVRQHLRSLTGFLEAITREDGSMPMLGDSSRHDEHVRYEAIRGGAAVLEDDRLRQAATRPCRGELDEGTRWLLAAAPWRTPDDAPGKVSATDSLRAFPEGGYWVMRATAEGVPLHLTFDCGPFSDPVVYNHGHADALSVDLSIGGDNLLLDPGMYSTHLGEEWRNYFRGTAAHNTVVVDGKDQTILEGTRRAYRRAEACPRGWLTTRDFDYVSGEHSGYRRLDAPANHRREIVFVKPHYWLLVDRLESSGGEHVYDLLFHLPPGARPETARSSGTVDVRAPSGRGLRLQPFEAGLDVSVVEGRERPPQGWVSFESGVKEPASVVSYQKTSRRSVVFATLLVPLTSARVDGSRFETFEAPGGLGGRLTLADEAEDVVLVRTDDGPYAGTLRTEMLETDGSLVVARFVRGGAPTTAIVLDASYLRHNGTTLFETSDVSTMVCEEGAWRAVPQEVTNSTLPLSSSWTETSPS